MKNLTGNHEYVTMLNHTGTLMKIISPAIALFGELSAGRVVKNQLEKKNKQHLGKVIAIAFTCGPKLTRKFPCN